MKRALLLLTFFCFACCAVAQNSRTRFSIGPEFSLPTYKEFPSNGVGGSIAVDFRSRHRVSANIETGYNYFKGTVINEFKHDTTRGFGFVPILAGVKLSLANKYYASMRAGITLGSSVGFTLSPAVGVMLPNRLSPKIDLGIKLIGVPGMPSIPENTFLDRGGFSYLSFRAAIVF
jgi:hypothetical protein